MTQPSMPIGVVVIGRNEGERLRRCLQSIPSGVPLVYVDSGSTDGSVHSAKEMNAQVVELDASTPFSAARARNAGFQALLDAHPELAAVQFVDGDCQLAAGWLDAGWRGLTKLESAVAVAGRLRERHPDASLYNRLCDIEWNVPAGEVKNIGGIGMIRAAALRNSGGFNPSVVAGEEPELCARLRHAGGRIYRLADEMAVHDADIRSFRQWWTRAVRTGYAYGLALQHHGGGPERLKVREIISDLTWALAIPLFAILCLLLALRWPWMLAGSAFSLGMYFVLWLKIHRAGRRCGLSWCDSATHAAACIISKCSHTQGLLRWWLDRRRQRVPTIIEYKSAMPIPSSSGKPSA